MRDNNADKKHGRPKSLRIDMFRKMVTSFLEHEKITTTDAKAKELRAIAERMIVLGKKGDLHATRQAAAYIRDKTVVKKLFTEIAPRYAERAGGYTRIIKLGIRPGDSAPVSVIELMEAELKAKPKTINEHAADVCMRHPGLPTTPDDDDSDSLPDKPTTPVKTRSK